MSPDNGALRIRAINLKTMGTGSQKDFLRQRLEVNKVCVFSELTSCRIFREITTVAFFPPTKLREGF